MKKINVLLFAMGLVSPAVFAQEIAPVSIPGVQFKALSLADYISQVRASSGAIQARKLSAESAISMEPLLSSTQIGPSISYSKGAYYGKTPYTPFVSPKSYTYSLSGTLEGFGKREARGNLAKADTSLAKMDVEVVSRTVELEAVFAYIDTLRTKLQWQAVNKEINRLLALEKTSDVSSLLAEQRLALENISNDIKFFAYGMTLPLGAEVSQLPEPIGNLVVTPREFDLKDLLSKALTSRTDILAVEAQLNLSLKNLEVTKKSRNIDLSLSVWYSYTPAYVSDGTNYDKTTAYGYSISMPLPTQNLYDGPVISASNNRTIAEIELRNLKHKATVEVHQAFLQYSAAKRKLQESEMAHVKKMGEAPATAEAIAESRESEMGLIDAKTNHAKALYALRWASGSYELF
jgi:outer membrane protein TolC